MRSLIGILDLSVEEIDELIAVADDIIANPAKYREACKYKTLATLFFEPSTRTRLSFESAMLSLGGNVLGFSDSNSSSAKKGESLFVEAIPTPGYSLVGVRARSGGEWLEGYYLGKVDGAVMEKVDAAIAVSFGLPRSRLV